MTCKSMQYYAIVNSPDLFCPNLPAIKAFLEARSMHTSKDQWCWNRSMFASDEHPLFDVIWLYDILIHITYYVYSICLFDWARHDTRSCSAAVPMCWPVQSCGTWSSKSLKIKCTVEVLCYCTVLLEMLDNPGFIVNANVTPHIIRIWSSLTALLHCHIRICITRGILLITGGRVTCTLLLEEQYTLSICSCMLQCCQLMVRWQFFLRMINTADIASMSDRTESLEASLLPVKNQEAVSTTPPSFYCKTSSEVFQNQIQQRKLPTNSSGIQFCWRHGASEAGESEATNSNGTNREVSHVVILV